MVIKQHGFGSNHSCLTALISFLDKVSGKTDSDETVDVYYLNFQKAVVVVNHMVFDQKVEDFGADAKMNGWIAQSLQGRSVKLRV